MTETSAVCRLIYAVIGELTFEKFARLKAKRQAASSQQSSHQE